MYSFLLIQKYKIHFWQQAKSQILVCWRISHKNYYALKCKKMNIGLVVAILRSEKQMVFALPGRDAQMHAGAQAYQNIRDKTFKKKNLAMPQFFFCKHPKTLQALEEDIHRQMRPSADTGFSLIPV